MATKLHERGVQKGIASGRSSRLRSNLTGTIILSLLRVKVRPAFNVSSRLSYPSYHIIKVFCKHFWFALYGRSCWWSLLSPVLRSLLSLMAESVFIFARDSITGFQSVARPTSWKSPISFTMVQALIQRAAVRNVFHPSSLAKDARNLHCQECDFTRGAR